MYIYNNHLCLSWKSNGISFTQAIEALKLNLKVVDTNISDKHVEAFVIYEFSPRNVQPPLTILVVYDPETYIKDRAVTNCCCIQRHSKNFGKSNRDITRKQH